jgi:hypothetical protein
MWKALSGGGIRVTVLGETRAEDGNALAVCQQECRDTCVEHLRRAASSFGKRSRTLCFPQSPSPPLVRYKSRTVIAYQIGVEKPSPLTTLCDS